MVTSHYPRQPPPPDNTLHHEHVVQLQIDRDYLDDKATEVPRAAHVQLCFTSGNSEFFPLVHQDDSQHGPCTPTYNLATAFVYTPDFGMLRAVHIEHGIEERASTTDSLWVTCTSLGKYYAVPPSDEPSPALSTGRTGLLQRTFLIEPQNSISFSESVLVKTFQAACRLAFVESQACSTISFDARLSDSNHHNVYGSLFFRLFYERYPDSIYDRVHNRDPLFSIAA